MKSIYFNEDHQLFRDSVRTFVEKEINPYAVQWEKDKHIPKSLLKKLGDLGFLGINHAEEFGGSDVDIFHSVAYLEEIAKSGFGGVAAMISVHQYMATNHLAEAGSNELKKKYLTPAINGDMLAAIAISEPGGGSDVGAMLTTATKEGDEYVINGSKTFITNGVEADFLVVACKTNPSANVNGVSLIIVEKGTPGFTATNLDKMGWHSSDTAELAFDQVRVPVSNLVGEENQGFFYIMESFQLERLVAGVIANAGSEAVIEATLKYMDERATFGRKIKKYQVLRHNLVQLVTELEAAKQLAYNASWKFEQGEVVVKECSMVKLLCTELSKRIVDYCFQIFGGYAFMEEYPIARAFRDTRISTIVGGTSEIMCEILSKIIVDDVKYSKVYQDTDEADSNAAPLTAKAIIESIPDRFKKDKVNGTSLTVNFDISGDDGGQYSVVIADQACALHEGLNEAADCTISATDEVYRDVETGKINPEMAVMSGQLKVSNLMAMMNFVKLFKRVK